MLGQIVFGIVGIAIGVALIVYARYIFENITGPIGFAERFLGSGGTYNFFRLLGIAVFALSLMVMFGLAGWIYDAIVHPLGTISGNR